MPIGSPRDRAVVLGGGIAGLLAAHVLADLYGEVLVVDRDELPEGDAPRRTVPQGGHTHALLARGQMAFERLLPSITDELVEDGAVVGDNLADARLRFGGHRMARSVSGLVAVSASRPFIEGHVRRRVRDHGRVRELPRRKVRGLVFDPGRRRVCGVRVVATEAASEAEADVLEADLVVDATGRQSHAPAWLRQDGIESPPEEQLSVDVTYVSCPFELEPDALDGDIAIIDAPTPATCRGAAVSCIEDGRGLVTLVGVAGERPPTDVRGFRDYARSFEVGDVADAIEDARPLDQPVPYRFGASRWRHWEKLRHPPNDFAVVGDAVCSFNPVYGQGMSVAALQAEALGEHLRDRARLDGRRFHRRVARIVGPPWRLAKGADLQFGLDGHRSKASDRLLGAYVGRLQSAAVTDPRLARAFVRVTGLVDPPQALVAPRNLLRVARAPT